MPTEPEGSGGSEQSGEVTPAQHAKTVQWLQEKKNREDDTEPDRVIFSFQVRTVV